MTPRTGKCQVKIPSLVSFAPCIILTLFLNFCDFKPRYSYKHYSYKKVCTKDLPQIANLQTSYSIFKFTNLSSSALGMFGTSSELFQSLLADLNIDELYTTSY